VQLYVLILKAVWLEKIFYDMGLPVRATVMLLVHWQMQSFITPVH